VSPIILAQAFPKSESVGIDYQDASIETATQRAAKAGDHVADNLNPVGWLYYGASSLACVPV
jgi:hypothetical protein